VNAESLEADEGALALRNAAVAASEAGAARRRLLIRLAQVGVGAAILLAWQLASGTLIDPFFISAPDAVFAKLVQWVERGTLLTHASYTFYATAVGFLIGAAAGFAVGFAFGRSATVAAIFDPYITALYCLPKIALAPLFIMWFGIGIESKIAMSAAVVFFLVFLNTFAGVRDVNPIHIHTTRIMGAGEWQLLRVVILPSAASWVLTGLKVSVPYALIGTVVGELISSNRGIGFLIGQAAGLFDTAGVFAGLTVLALAGVVINGGLKRLERHVLRWRTPA
jgi:NitT/TauT family transport system permease protein